MRRTIVWRSPPVQPWLAHAEIHLWWVALEDWRSQVVNLSQWLSVDEQIRAGEFYNKRDQQRFIISRGILRHLLGQYLQQAPADLEFTYGPYGKPDLAPPLADGGLCFNLSHSQDRALYAIARQCRVGIDLEKIRPLSNPHRFIRRILSAQEQADLNALSEAEQQQSLFYYWTAKEAYIKAVGTGVFQLARHVDVSVTSPTPLIRQVGHDVQEGRQWRLDCFQPMDGYAGALVSDGPLNNLSCWHYQGLR